MRILLAEDDRMTRRVMESQLTRWGYDVTAVEDGLQAWNILQKSDSPRFVLLDWMMPGMDGIDVCRRIRQAGDNPYRYVIMLTGKDEQEDIVEGLEAGADDYLTKPASQAELRVRIRAGKRILDLQDELLAAQEALQYQATHDPLTGLWNRGAIMDALHREVARCQRENNPVAVVLCDIDEFKLVNDTHGHAAGDIVLKEIAGILRDSIRIYDSVGRYGGEEFLVLLPGCGKEQGLNQTERVRKNIADKFIKIADQEIGVTMSLGVCICDFSGGDINPEALVDEADKALYEAKENGRNRVVMAES
jgi:two-component system, cell cycle response regulator